MQPPEAWYVARTMQALEVLAFEPLSAPQVAATLGVHPRTARRLLNRLLAEGYLTRTPDARRLYAPTMRIVALAAQIVERAEITRRARPYVARLHELAGATAHLMLPSYRSVMCVVHCDSDAPGGPRLRELVPSHCTAAGKVLLSWRDPWRESVLAAPLEPHTERTVIDPARLRDELAAVRARGYATEDGEFQPGVRAVAAPVFTAGEAVAALGLSAVDRTDGPVAGRVVALADELSDALEAAHG